MIPKTPNDMDKIKVYNLKLHGSTLTDQIIDNHLGSLRYEIECMEVGETLELEIEYIEMTQEEYEKLPEFDGF